MHDKGTLSRVGKRRKMEAEIAPERFCVVEATSKPNRYVLGGFKVKLNHCHFGSNVESTPMLLYALYT